MRVFSSLLILSAFVVLALSNPVYVSQYLPNNYAAGQAACLVVFISSGNIQQF